MVIPIIIQETKIGDLFARLFRRGRGKSVIYGQKAGAGKGKGMPGGLRRNKNTEPCEEGPGFGEGEGKGLGKKRKS